MKKIILSIAVIALFSTACHKSRTCTCTTTSTPQSGGSASTDKTTTTEDHLTKHEAASQCYSSKETLSIPAGTTTLKVDVVSDCSLK